MIGVCSQTKPRSWKKRCTARAAVAHPQHRADRVGARAQVGDLAQELHRVRLLQRVVRVGPADHAQARRPQLERLPLALRRDQVAFGFHRTARVEPGHLGLVVRELRSRHDLQTGEARAVRDVEEREPALRVAAVRSQPRSVTGSPEGALPERMALQERTFMEAAALPRGAERADSKGNPGGWYPHPRPSPKGEGETLPLPPGEGPGMRGACFQEGAVMTCSPRSNTSWARPTMSGSSGPMSSAFLLV